jgi:hypothetical protein
MSASGNARDDDEAFFRRLVLPEEDRRRLTNAPWAGGFRWFRSPNVVDLLVYRAKLREQKRQND